MDLQLFQKKRILVVDDSPVEVDYISAALLPLGCIINTAGDAHQALTHLKKDAYDLVLLDIVLPGQDGFTILEAMQANAKTKEIPTIFLSGLSNKEQVIQGLSKGAVDYIVKPFHPDELIQRLNVHLKLKDANDKLKTELARKMRIEEALHQREQLFRNYFRNSSFIQVISHYEDGRIVDVNEIFEKELGYSRKDVIGKKSVDVFWTEDQRNIILQDIQQTGYSKDREVIIKNKKGENRTGIVSVTQYQSRENKYLILTGIDITPRLELEKKIRENEQTLKQIAINIPLPFCTASNEGVIQFSNNKFTELFGYTLEDIPTVEAWFQHAYPNPDYRKEVIERWNRAIAEYDQKGLVTSEKQEYKITCKDGTVRTVEIYFTKNDENIFNIFKDITKEKETLLEIKKLSEAIYQSPASIVITNQEGIIEFVNPKFTEVTEYTFDEAVGQNPRILQSGLIPLSFYQEMWQTIMSGKTWQGEFINKKKSGEAYWENATIAPILDENKAIVNFIAIKEDITEKKKAIEALVKSEAALKEANATKDKFFSIIAHDLRNPIGAIGNLAYLLVNDSEIDCKSKEMLKHIYNSATTTFSLLENLLNWAKSQSGKLTVNPVNFEVDQEIVFAVEPLENLAKSKNIDIIIRVAKETKAYGDKELFSTIIRNLVSNAIKFTPQNGKISVKTEHIGSYIHIFVTDTGVGIDSSRISKLFRVDQNTSTRGTSNESGTGMGLPLTKEFVEKNEGEIWIESSIGKGSTFTFTIPAGY